jgi:methionine synthase II (cobalamin-independent)
MSNIISPFSTTGIGSTPHTRPGEACALIEAVFDIPFWPQLPKYSFRESMVTQYTEGMPFLRIDEASQKVYVERDETDELDRFYESQTEGTRIAISEDYAVGLHAFLKSVKHRRFKLLKGHITGPLTFTLGLKNGRGAAIYFDEELREIGSLLLQAKARWQVDLLKQFADDVIIFIDEPIFSAIGSSSYLGVAEDEILRMLRDSVSAIEGAGGIAGIHCCGRADWKMIIDSGAKILNFDAFDYFDTLAMYSDELKGFLDNGGYLAWGIVPTSDSISSVTDSDISALLKERVSKLHNLTKSDLIYSQALITPSCGTGSRTVEEATKIFQLTMRAKEAMTG